ncbi:unnamed protein product [Adineta ricciae]|uniref:Uncharacterized protein n=1 Tax=Adineta ricciae TaxID=249248 RepID=A0A814Y663_ADIRI|nr:unnamed protein product [Adineta ricciae]
MNKLSSKNFFRATCSYEYTFAAKTSHTLVRIDYTHKKVIFYHNSSYLALKELDIDKHRVITETILSTNQTRVQLKICYECSFEDNCHLPIDGFLQIQSAVTFINYDYATLIQRLNQFYRLPINDIHTYFHADSLTSTINGFRGYMNQFDKANTKTLKPKCSKSTDKLKSRSMKYAKAVKLTVYTCNGPEQVYCKNEKSMKEFFHGITLQDYMGKFLGRQ